MDPLQAKVGADLRLGVDATEDEFYDQNSCDWLHLIRSILNKTWKPKPLKRCEPLRTT